MNERMGQKLPLLPKGWNWAEIQDIGIVASGQTPKGVNELGNSGEIPYYKVGDMNKPGNEVFMSESDISLSPGDTERLRIHIRNQGTVIFPKRGGAIATNKKRILTRPSAYDLNVMGVFPLIMPNKYFYYWLSMIDLISLADGSNVPQINHKDIEPLSFPVAPLPEQHRIVAKIEELFTELDAGIESLKKAQAQLKQYRQSVLKAAVEGKLTEEWRAAHKDELEPASVLLERIQKERREKWEAEQLESFAAKGKTPKDDKWKGKYEESMTPDMESFPKLPDVWKWTSIGALFGTSYGLSERLSKTEPDNELDVPVLRIPNVTEFGTLDLSNLKYFPLEKPKRDKLSVKKGDILFNWRNAPKWIGRSAVFDRDGEFVNASFLLKLRPCSVGYSNFISLYLNYLRISGYFLTRIDNAVNQANFNASKTRQIEVALPPLTEQVEIIKVVERCFSLADNLDDTIGMELERAQRLRQSILKQAFSGKLVPQDPNDEPASVLLERIKAEKAVREAENKRARKSKAKPKKEPKQMELL